MAENNAFFSIWTQDTPYLLIVEGMLANKLPGFASAHNKPNLCYKKVKSGWSDHWLEAADTLRSFSPDGVGYRAGILPLNDLPELHEITPALRAVREISAIAANLWLVDDINHGRLGCYLQRVVDRRGKQVGFEAFARMESLDGGIIGGGAIMKAATELHVEYQIDRLLHKQAIDSYVNNDLEGYIFINFLTGFIQRPEIYLDGLSQAATKSHIRSGVVVLDVPLSDYARDVQKLKSIAEYCRARGFLLALDDITSADGLESLLSEIRPAFVKLDGKFGHAMSELKKQSVLREIIRLAHGIGANVLAEGVENKESYDSYFKAEVDMFQGYLFGAPERVPQEREQAKA